MLSASESGAVVRGGAVDRAQIRELLDRVRWPTRFPSAGAVVLSLILGLVSLAVLPRSLAYDPWSWLNWGRELDHLRLTTRGSGTSFKPLTVFLAAVLAPTGHLAPWLWLAISRAGLVLTVLLAFHVGRRLQGPVAGAIAVAGVLTILQFVSYLAMTGMSEPLLSVFTLAAVYCGVSGSRRAAFVWLVAASLLELELAGVMVLYGLVFIVWPSGQRARGIAVMFGLLLALGACWLLPDLISTGNVLRSATLARNATLGGPEVGKHPFVATLDGARHMVLWTVWAGWLGEVAVGTAALVRRRALRPLFLPALLGGLFIVGCAVLTQMHKMTGNTRFMVCAAVVGAVVAACFWVEATGVVVARLVGLAERRGSELPGSPGARLRRATSGALAVLVVGLLAVNEAALREWPGHIRTAVANDHASQVAEKDLPRAIVAAGGRAAVLSCKPVEAMPLMVSAVAWALNVPSSQVGDRPTESTGTSFMVRPPQTALGRGGPMKVVWEGRTYLQVRSSCRD